MRDAALLLCAALIIAAAQPTAARITPAIFWAIHILLTLSSVDHLSIDGKHVIATSIRINDALINRAVFRING